MSVSRRKFIAGLAAVPVAAMLPALADRSGVLIHKGNTHGTMHAGCFSIGHVHYNRGPAVWPRQFADTVKVGDDKIGFDGRMYRCVSVVHDEAIFGLVK